MNKKNDTDLSVYRLLNLPLLTLMGLVAIAGLVLTFILHQLIF